jgi:hypothetical protein
MQPLVRPATECVAHSLADDPRLATAGANLGDLIIGSMPSCLNPDQAAPASALA